MNRGQAEATQSRQQRPTTLQRQQAWQPEGQACTRKQVRELEGPTQAAWTQRGHVADKAAEGSVQADDTCSCRAGLETHPDSYTDCRHPHGAREVD